MRIPELVYGEARDVADYLHRAHGVTHEQVLAALINALNRIAALEAMADEANPPAGAGEGGDES